MIRVILPYHLRSLANVTGEVNVQTDGPPTIAAVLDRLEMQYPTLRGTIRDYATKKRRPFIRFFAEGTDLSNEPADILLPEAVVKGTEPLRVVGAMAGG
jgi:sulfur-carrier protein